MGVFWLCKAVDWIGILNHLNPEVTAPSAPTGMLTEVTSFQRSSVDARAFEEASSTGR